jgi:putative nucleotidyltransferase with HDIG domain
VFWARLAVSNDWVRGGPYVILLLGVSVASAFLASPGLYSQKIPELRREDVGKPFRASSQSGFKAGRDYELLDEAKTLVRREEARSKVRPVFDYDTSVQPTITRTIQDGFADMQAVVAKWDEEHKAALKKLPEDPAAAGVVRKKPLEGEVELLTKLREARPAFEQHAALADDEDFEALAAARFSREAERAVLSLIEVAYRAKLVTSREELSRVDTFGITVRILGGSSEHEMTTTAPAVLDLHEAARELDRFASGPDSFMPDSSQVLRRALLRMAKRQIRSNLSVNIAETETRRRAAYDTVKPVVVGIKKGQKVLGDGELVNDSHLVVVEGMRAQTDELDVLQLQVGGAGLVAIVISALFAFHWAAFRRFRPTRKDALFMGLLLLLGLSGMHLWGTIADAIHDRYAQVPVDVLHFAFPVAFGAMLVRFVLYEELALFFALVFSFLSGLLWGNSLSFGVFTLVTSLVAADRITRAKDRAGIFRAGLVMGVVGVGLVLFMGLAEGKGVSVEGLVAAAFALISGAFVVPMVVMALTPLSEAAFGYASDIKLLELANLNHPALKELIVKAPGTYHHSIIMGSLVEAAAEAIGANPLLARSCAYYHDIGKGRNAMYFGENQKGENRHDELAPAMSAVIIKRHVTEGLEMAREYKLPRRVADAIPQHHGTRLVGYFFHKAKKEQEAKENPQPVDEAIYRYPGPKPQFREAALVMIADAVEAASRSMSEPTTPNLQALVQKLINMVFSEGQLDDCDLTLKDLHLISQSFVRTLEGIYHERPAYPPGALGGGKSAEPLRSVPLNKAAEGKRVGSTS